MIVAADRRCGSSPDRDRPMSDPTSSLPRRLAPTWHPWALLLLFTAGGLLQASPVEAQTTPTVGQEGKDVPWVPTPDVLVDTMLEMAEVSPDDLVVDLGSGDGRTVIAAARLGARAIGIEYDPELVALSTQRAAEAGVSDLTEFIATDLFEYDLSQATVITLFLLPDLNLKLRPTLFTLEPGTRIVSNTWELDGWDDDPDAGNRWAPDDTVVLDPCPTWCTSLLWVVPAKVDGTWRLSDDDLSLRLDQTFQMVSGTLRTETGTIPIEDGRLRGTEIQIRAGDTRYTGHVDGTTMSGTAQTPSGAVTWSATRRQRSGQE